jgi:hypothetical protein
MSAFSLRITALFLRWRYIRVDSTTTRSPAPNTLSRLMSSISQSSAI